MKPGNLLIFGARKKSIGEMVGKLWRDMFDDGVVTAGISGEEDINCLVADDLELAETLRSVKPSRVLVTIGTNETLEESKGDVGEWLFRHLEVNVIYPMLVLEAWLEQGPPAGAHFVALSSNSAVIPRSRSMAYCASKSALSMAIRCAARDAQKAKRDTVIYGFEPGLVKGTPMSGERHGTRMLGLPQGMSRRALAHQIVSAMAFGGAEYNGCLIRLDNGEV